MPKINEDYIRWDSESLKRLIVQKLSEDPNFTDHIFQDSNLTTLIDVFSFMYDTLTYYLNHGASEAMFSDSEIYENMNRIVKMLGYNPDGFTSSVIDSLFVTRTEFINNLENSAWNGVQQKILPKYTSIDTGLSDALGRQIFYSLINVRFLEPEDGVFSPLSEDRTKMVNGRWKLYERTFTSEGLPFETFELDSINLSTDDPNIDTNFISHPYIDVFIRRNNSVTGVENYIPFKGISEGTIFSDSESIFTSKDDVFELRINERQRYSLTFGDDIHGSRLKDGDELYIIYLEGNGEDAEINADTLNESNGQMTLSVAGLDSDIYLQIIGVNSDDIPTQDQLDELYVRNVSESTQFNVVETVAEIRQNAPNWFRMGQRLITKQDFNQFVFKEFKEDIFDVRTMNNWEYLNEFLGWLESIRDCESESGTRLKPDIRERDYIYADSCDFNNIYIWTKFKGEAIDSRLIEQEMINRKCLTAEPIILKSLDTHFIPCLSGAFGPQDINGNYPCIVGENGYDYRFVDSSDPTRNGWDPDVENFIEIVKDNTSVVTPEKVKSDVINSIRDFFKPKNNTIGGIVDLRELHNNLLNIEGVSVVKTVFEKTVNDAKTRFDFNGLSFAAWTQELAGGEDKFVFNGNIDLKNFQFPRLAVDDNLQIEKRVKVVFESFGSPSVEY